MADTAAKCISATLRASDRRSPFIVGGKLTWRQKRQGRPEPRFVGQHPSWWN